MCTLICMLHPCSATLGAPLGDVPLVSLHLHVPMLQTGHAVCRVHAADSLTHPMPAVQPRAGIKRTLTRWR